MCSYSVVVTVVGKSTQLKRLNFPYHPCPRKRGLFISLQSQVSIFFFLISRVHKQIWSLLYVHISVNYYFCYLFYIYLKIFFQMIKSNYENVQSITSNFNTKWCQCNFLEKYRQHSLRYNSLYLYSISNNRAYLLYN